MKVFFDTTVLVDVAIDENSISSDVLHTLEDAESVSLWLSAISFKDIYDTVASYHGAARAADFSRLIADKFSIIPFRKSTFLKVLPKKDMESEYRIQMASAEDLNVDFIISKDLSHYEDSKITVLTPTDFLEKWNAGELDSITQVPFLDLKAQHHQIYNEIDDRITDIITNTGFILGKHVDEFEKGFAELQGAKYCIGVSSGTDALHIALMALGIGPGDAVIVPVNTFIATAEAVSFTGAVPVFVDCDEYYNVDVNKIATAIQKAEGGREKERSWKVEKVSEKGEGRIRAIMPVHLYGQPANMDAVMALAEEYGLFVVEDACQAHLAEWQGKKVGALGAFGVFSFYPGKNLGAYGEAGALITNDEELYNKAKMIRQHGEIERYHHKVVGHNYRMEAIQGAVLSTKAKYIEGWTRKRQENARLYDELLSEIEGVEIPQQLDGVSAVYHLYVIQVDDRDGLQAHLQKNGIGTGLHYPVPLHLQEAYKHLGYEEGDFPVAERAAKRILSLPMYPELTERQIRYVCEKIKEYREDRS